ELPGDAGANNVYDIVVTANDGSLSVSKAVAITVSNVVETATDLDLAAADDSGSSNTDNITRNTTALPISGSGENGATVTLFDDANQNGLKDAGEATLNTTVVSAGVFSAD